MTQLDGKTKRKLLRDIEAHPEYSCEEVVKLDTKYQGDLLQAVRNRFHYLKRLKKENPKKYWKLFGEANEIGKNELDLDPEDDSPSKLVATWGSKPNTRSSSSNKATTKTPPPEQEPIIEEEETQSPAPQPLPEEVPSSSWSFSTPIKRKKTVNKMAPKKGTPSKLFHSPHSGFKQAAAVQRENIFKNKSEAMDAVDETIDVDLHYPEENGSEFLVHRVDECLSITDQTGTVVADKIRITLKCLVDLRDYDNYTGNIVLNGKGFLVTGPKVPHFLLHNHEGLSDLEQTPCERTKNKLATFANAVLGDPTRLVQTVLFLMPEEVIISTDFVNAVPPIPTHDQKAKLRLREYPLETEVGLAKAKMNQMFYPGWWEVRVVPATAPQHLRVNDEANDGIETAFQGSCMIASTTRAKATFSASRALFSVSAPAPAPAIPKPVTQLPSPMPTPIKAPLPAPQGKLIIAPTKPKPSKNALVLVSPNPVLSSSGLVVSQPNGPPAAAPASNLVVSQPNGPPAAAPAANLAVSQPNGPPTGNFLADFPPDAQFNVFSVAMGKQQEVRKTAFKATTNTTERRQSRFAGRSERSDKKKELLLQRKRLAKRQMMQRVSEHNEDSQLAAMAAQNGDDNEANDAALRQQALQQEKTETDDFINDLERIESEMQAALDEGDNLTADDY
ncbi:unknown protein [Seminavis robusta]|uniref:Uncharacterized protein n=1 Tax=Seminavis robusta TaxID=568900 RepID=A0A9N8EQX1_9STRA|nr:unknown protein [Seminavis robusta]|eukprot:Sro1697_g291890.1 n/a (673) ;mRNA; r:9993-12157